VLAGSAKSAAADAALASNWTAPMKAMERGLDQLPLELVYVEVEASTSGGREEVPSS
jgi:hypothetical protein